MTDKTDGRPKGVRLADEIKTAETPEERREAVYAWVDYEIERNRETYDKLAKE